MKLDLMVNAHSSWRFCFFERIQQANCVAQHFFVVNIFLFKLELFVNILRIASSDTVELNLNFDNSRQIEYSRDLPSNSWMSKRSCRRKVFCTNEIRSSVYGSFSDVHFDIRHKMPRRLVKHSNGSFFCETLCANRGFSQT